MITRLVRKIHRAALKKICAQKGVRVRLSNEHIVRLDPDFMQYRHFGTRHNEAWRFCIEACRGKRNFVDVGAHIGLYTIPAALVMQHTGRVIAFEPGKKNHEVLLRHIAMNDVHNVCSYNCLLGDEEKTVSFYEDVVSPSAMNSVAKSAKIAQKTDRYVEHKCRQLTLDQICASEDIKPQVVKVDVEGAELFVLHGARKMFSEARPLVFLSIHPGRMSLLGHCPEDILRFIGSVDYEVRTTDNSKPSEISFGEYILAPQS